MSFDGDDSTTDDISKRNQQLESENAILRDELRKMQTHVDQANRLTFVLVLESVLDALSQHYIATIEAGGQPNMSLTDPFYVMTDTSTYLAMPKNAQYLIESLWMGRIDSTTIELQNQPARLSLHSSKLRDGRPLVEIVDVDGNTFPVVQRYDHRAHSFICKNHPQFPGMLIGTEQIGVLQDMLTTRDFLQIDRKRVSHWSSNTSLEDLGAVWLGRPRRAQSKATLLVDHECIRALIDCLSKKPDTRVHFICYGQAVMQAYLLLTANNGCQSEIMRVPIGTI